MTINTSFSESSVISSRASYGNDDQIDAERLFKTPPGYKFDLGSVILTKTSQDGDVTGPRLEVISDVAVKVIGTTRHHRFGTSGHLEFQVTANMIKL